MAFLIAKRKTKMLANICLTIINLALLFVLYVVLIEHRKLTNKLIFPGEKEVVTFSKEAYEKKPQIVDLDSAKSEILGGVEITETKEN